MEELLERKTKEELKQIALGLEIPKISVMKKDEIIEAIREKRKLIEEEIKKLPENKKKRERPEDVVEIGRAHV